jgi:hypothetical protein
LTLNIIDSDSTTDVSGFFRLESLLIYAIVKLNANVTDERVASIDGRSTVILEIIKDEFKLILQYMGYNLGELTVVRTFNAHHDDVLVRHVSR